MILMHNLIALHKCIISKQTLWDFWIYKDLNLTNSLCTCWHCYLKVPATCIFRHYNINILINCTCVTQLDFLKFCQCRLCKFYLCTVGHLMVDQNGLSEKTPSLQCILCTEEQPEMMHETALFLCYLHILGYYNDWEQYASQKGCWKQNPCNDVYVHYLQTKCSQNKVNVKIQMQTKWYLCLWLWYVSSYRLRKKEKTNFQMT